LLYSGIALAQEPTVEFEGRCWVTDLDAKVKVSKSGIGEKFDLKSDLGVDDQNLPEGRLYWHTGPSSRIRFAYTQADFKGDETVTRSIQFSGQTFNVGTRVVSKFDIKYFRFSWIWQFLNFIGDKLKLGTIIEAKAINADVSLEAPDLSVKESEKFWGGLPTVGLALDINPVNKVDLFAEFSGLGAGNLGYFFDAEAGIKFMPTKYFAIIGGYRTISIKAEDSHNFASMNMRGPFVGATLRF